VNSHWKDPLKVKWFEQYAYPITDKTYEIWSDNPNDWLQINHSCDPNTWVDGLNLVSRKSIKKGEQISMDYATFCTDNMQSFQCKCGNSQCRGQITGTDYLKPFLSVYGNHISDYVDTKRKQNGSLSKDSNESSVVHNGHHH